MNRNALHSRGHSLASTGRLDMDGCGDLHGCPVSRPISVGKKTDMLVLPVANAPYVVELGVFK